LEYDAAIEGYQKSISILDQLIANGLDVELSNQMRQVMENELRSIEVEAVEIRAALDDWNTFISRPEARSRLLLRITVLARDERFDEIPQSAEMLRLLDSENSFNLYNAACGYAICANAIVTADEADSTSEQLTRRQEYIDLALDCLRESIAAGYSDFQHLQQDPDLAVLRELAEFQELLHMPPAPVLPE
jgi:hypothetical protein